MQATDEMFNGATREIDMKVCIYFDSTPTVVTKNNYLIDCYVDEKTWCGEASLLGSLTPNSVDISLANPNRIFTPTNTASPYYGKIQIGLKLEINLRINGSDWIPAGTYYVTEWAAPSADSLIVNVYASDNLTKVLKADSNNIIPIKAPTYRRFIEYYFNQLQKSITINGNFNNSLLWGMSTGKISDDLQQIAHATWALIRYNRNNVLIMHAIKNTANIRATITDDDQIISISAKQSLTKTYDGVSFEFFMPIETYDELVQISSFDVNAGISDTDAIEFNKKPVIALSDISCATADTIARVYSYHYTPEKLFLSMESTEFAGTTDITVRGKYLNQTSYVNEDICSNPFKYSNHFVQTGDYAKYFKANLNRYVETKLPLLTVEIRGNMLFDLGDKIEVNSEFYHTNFIGRIVSIKSKYDGAFSQTIMLLDDNIIG